ncbi:Uncharacterised protein [Vibrio cholerae]|nr:Uncharacterised protein [Vibrio cholerae]CSC86939.1 Uncharacterised protein [Vibrio cholerae]
MHSIIFERILATSSADNHFFHTTDTRRRISVTLLRIDRNFCLIQVDSSEGEGGKREQSHHQHS